MWPSLQTAGLLSLLAGATGAIQVDFNSDDSIKDAASTVAFGLLKYYTGNNTGDVPGNLPDPYFWWEAGSMFGTLIDYWFHTGDSTYNAVTTQGMLHQAGEDSDYMPQNQTSTLGNDDQGFWAMAAMSAAENNFPNPPADQPQWLALVQAVFNEYVDRWDTETCGGGLRWQIFTFNNGFNYKNSISNGCFFNIASRLARYTGNQTYADWAEKVWDWMTEVKYIDADFNIFDGAGVEQDCKDINQAQWTYNAGIFLQGAAAMYNFTEGQSNWEQRTAGLLNRTISFFFDDGIVVERPCESFNFCDFDQQSFKGYLLRWMASTAQLAPFTFDTAMPLIKSSAAAAAQQCSGSPAANEFKGVAGTACGFKWTEKDKFDGLVGVGEQMSALSALQYSLIKKETAAPLTADTGGTSVGNPDAGRQMAEYMPKPLREISIGEKVAAGFVTTAVAFSVVGAVVFLLHET
ncbi:glycoside hydrolase family 76 protein [Hypoxylon fragiforme]|uniref:glycoside hydrolase family 76 protein n=1 Tax=Hypoxylon fragiforme TaxID=63214 RepID=UPI0020C6A878|nr:glycoside hydrolase family 76 protein [Hypoxylon fragiforme]KAI2608878.1 glycoside hydrolase family 76 protein [Hypoxylon fragiforme]